MKEFPKSSNQKVWKKEVKALESLFGHQNILKIVISGYNENNNFCIITEMCHSNLEVYLASLKRDAFQFTNKMIIRLFKHMTEALRFMQKRGLIHLDIKPSNVLVNVYDTGNIYKLGDFGSTQKKSKFMKTLEKVGSVGYMSPEILNESNNTDRSYQADLWSTGTLPKSPFYTEVPSNTIHLSLYLFCTTF